MPFDGFAATRAALSDLAPNAPEKTAVASFRKGFIEAATAICDAATKSLGNEKGRSAGALLAVRMLLTHMLQRKMFLNGDIEYLRNQFEKCRREGRNYHDDFLRPLFEKGLGGGDTSPEAQELLGVVPYVNGGLFADSNDPTAGLSRIPDKAFLPLLDFFDSLEWISERVAATELGQVNAAVIGNVFESFLSQKKNGAFYTPFDVTAHVAQGTIYARFIDRAATLAPRTLGPNGTAWKRARLDPRRYLKAGLLQGLPNKFRLPKGKDPSDLSHYGFPGETWRMLKARIESLDIASERIAKARNASDLAAANADMLAFVMDVVEAAVANGELAALWTAATSIRVIDPTCGGGAFLLAALQSLMLLLTAIAQAPGSHALPDAATRRSPVALASHALARSIFGVDLMPEAAAAARTAVLGYALALAEVQEDIRPLATVTLNIRSGNAIVGAHTVSDAGKALGAPAARRVKQALVAVRGGASTRMKRIEAEADIQTGRDVLDRQVAKSLGIRANAQDSWIKSVRPFHWGLEFLDVMDSGGFDVIVGNPPYVEFKNMPETMEAALRAYPSASCDNLYGPCLERACQIMAPDGWMGMVVPNSLTGVEKMQGLRESLFGRFSIFLASCYGTAPAKLFEGVEQRICMFIAKGKSGAERTKLFASRYHHWTMAQRPTLLDRIAYQPSWVHPSIGSLALTGSPVLGRLLERLRDSKALTVASLVDEDGLHDLVYHRSPRYWTRAMESFPEFKSFRNAGKTRSDQHYRVLSFREKDVAKAVGALFCSSLFFVWFTSIGSARNVARREILGFPLGRLARRDLRELAGSFDRLQRDLKRKSRLKATADSERREYFAGASKPLIDDIDRVLARVLGMSQPELDYVLHVDEKIRLGS